MQDPTTSAAREPPVEHFGNWTSCAWMLAFAALYTRFGMLVANFIHNDPRLLPVEIGESVLSLCYGSRCICLSKQEWIYFALQVVLMASSVFIPRASKQDTSTAAKRVLSVILYGFVYADGLVTNVFMAIGCIPALAVSIVRIVDPESRPDIARSTASDGKSQLSFMHGGPVSTSELETPWLYNLRACNTTRTLMVLLFAPVIRGIVIRLMTVGLLVRTLEAAVIISSLLTVVLFRLSYTSAEKTYWSQRRVQCSTEFYQELFMVVMVIGVAFVVQQQNQKFELDASAFPTVNIWVDQLYGVSVGWVVYENSTPSHTILASDFPPGLVKPDEALGTETSTSELINVVNFALPSITCMTFWNEMTQHIIQKSGILDFGSNKTLVFMRFFPDSNYTDSGRLIAPRCVYDMHYQCDGSVTDITLFDIGPNVTIGNWRRDLQKVYNRK